MTTITSSSDNSLSLRQALEYCLDILKMKQHFGFMIRTTTSVPITMTRTLRNWIIAMKLIADWNGAWAIAITYSLRRNYTIFWP